MSWKILETGVKRGNEELISILSNKTIRFIRNAIDNHNLSDKKNIRILIDREGSKFNVGFLFLDSKGDNTLKLSHQKNGSAFISGSSLLSTLKLKPEEIKKKYAPDIQTYDGNKLLVIEIKKV